MFLTFESLIGCYLRKDEFSFDVPDHLCMDSGAISSSDLTVSDHRVDCAHLKILGKTEVGVADPLG